MPFIPTINCAKVSLKQKLFNQDVINTLWFSWQGAEELTIYDLEILNTAIYSWWDLHLKLAVSSDLTLVEITSTDQSSDIAPSVPFSFTPLPGDLVGASCPSNVCITVSFRTAERGRSARGRNYISGLRELDVAANVVANSVLDELETSYGNLIDNPPDNWTWVVVSHTNDGVNRAFGLKQVIIDAICVDSHVDSQRRRLTGRGN